MVHADSALLPPTLSTKADFYAHLHASLASLLQGQTSWVTNLANASSLLHASLNDWRRRRGSLPTESGSGSGSNQEQGEEQEQEEDPTKGKPLNWTGFYLLSFLFPHPQPDLLSRGGGRRVPTLVLGPFHGLPACQAIPSLVGRGVCADGSAALPPRSVRVARTDEYPGHIACDSLSKSELVIPLVLPLSSLSEPNRSNILRASKRPNRISDDATQEGEEDLTAWSNRISSEGQEEKDAQTQEIILGVLDIDCVEEEGFDEVDQAALEECVRIIVRSCSW